MFIRRNEPSNINLQKRLQELARNMRKHPTIAEAYLWQYLRNKKLYNIKFRRQHPLFFYIIDFYCPKNKLIIEIDGPIHEYQLTKDGVRDNFFSNEGYTIIRFTNYQVLHQVSFVLITIKHNVDILKPSPKRGEERVVPHEGPGEV